MSRLRISIVEYLNTTPLVWGFTAGALAGKYDLSFTVPSQCAEALRRGAADVAIIPAIEYQRIASPEGLVMFPGMSVAAKNEVRSILVLSKVPIENARRIALDTSSRSSAALVRILCAKHWRNGAEFVDALPDAAAMLAAADAALVIGDPALRISIELAARARKDAGEPGRDGHAVPSSFPGMDELYVYDVAREWQKFAGLPCVLAVWVARRDAVTAELLADFCAAAEFGFAHIPEIAQEASQKLGLPVAALESYLRDNVDFSLDAENLLGLELYYRMAAEMGLIPRAKPIEFAVAAVSARASMP